MAKDPCEFFKSKVPPAVQHLRDSVLGDLTTEDLFHLKIENPSEFERRFDRAFAARTEKWADMLNGLENPVLNNVGRAVARWLSLGPGDPETRRLLKDYESAQEAHNAFMSRMAQETTRLSGEDAERLFMALHEGRELDGELEPLRKDIAAAFERYADIFIESGAMKAGLEKGYVPFTYPSQRKEMVDAWATRFFGKMANLFGAKAKAEKSPGGYDPKRTTLRVHGLGTVSRHVANAGGRFKERTIRDINKAIEAGLDMSVRPILGGLAQEGKAAAALQFMLRLSEQTNVVKDDGDEVPTGFVQLDGKEFGPLNGKWVRKDVAGYVIDIARPDKTGLVAAVGALNALFKKWAVLGRPSALMTGNVLGNVFMGRMLQPFSAMPKTYGEAFKQIMALKKTGKPTGEIKELIEAGQFTGESRFMQELQENEGPYAQDIQGSGKEYAVNWTSRFLDMLDFEARRTGDGSIPLAGWIRAIGNSIGHFDLALGTLRKATGARSAQIGGGAMEELWSFTDNMAKLAAYIHMRREGGNDLIAKWARKSSGKPLHEGGLAPDVAIQRVKDFWDLRAMPKFIKEWRQTPLIGWSFVSYPYLTVRELLLKGHAFRNPLGAFFWMFPGALLTSAYQAFTGEEDEEVDKDRLLAAGGNQKAADMLVPLFKDGDGRKWHINLGAAGAWDMLTGVADPTGRLLEGGTGNAGVRWLFSSNPLMSHTLNLGGFSPYSGRPTDNYRWWHWFLAATPSIAVNDFWREQERLDADARAGKAAARTGLERGLEAVTGFRLRTAGAPGSGQRARQKAKAEYQERIGAFSEAGGGFAVRPKKPEPDADDELLDAYQRVTSRH